MPRPTSRKNLNGKRLYTFSCIAAYLHIVATCSDTIADRTLFFFCSPAFFLLDRLAKILAKKNLNEKKLDELKIKANILAAFTEKDEKKDETIAREKAEL